ncbi:hypothetical protein MMC18_000272 [Xylographa bjoerkii]|nr:hypothetical protein [Xylographa bjoerkii]
MPDALAACDASARAFFPFEIYRKLFAFGRKTHKGHPILDAGDQARLFMVTFSVWEQEEMACVCDYLLINTQDVFDRLEDQFVAKLQAEARISEEIPENLEGRYYLTASRLDLVGLSIFTEEHKQRHHLKLIHKILTFGLPYLKRLDETDQSGRLDLITPFESPFGDYSHETSLVDVCRRSYLIDCFRRDLTWPRSASSFTETVTERNLAWIWARAFRGADLCEYSIYRPENCTIISIGYVFWDESRLWGTGLLDIARRDLKQVPRRSRKAMPSAEERLKGMTTSYDFLHDEYAEFFLANDDKPDLDQLEY